MHPLPPLATPPPNADRARKGKSTPWPGSTSPPSSMPATTASGRACATSTACRIGIPRSRRAVSRAASPQTRSDACEIFACAMAIASAKSCSGSPTTTCSAPTPFWSRRWGWRTTSRPCGSRQSPTATRRSWNGPPSSTARPSARTNSSAISGPACFRAVLMHSNAPWEASVPHIVKSTILDAPTGAVWNVLRDFNGHDRWHPAVATSTIERAQASDRVGCVRRFKLTDGSELREQLLALSDLEQTFSYCLLDTPIAMFNYVAHVRLLPVTDGDRTFWHWESRFMTRPADQETITQMVAEQIYQAGFEAIRQHLKEAA